MSLSILSGLSFSQIKHISIEPQCSGQRGDIRSLNTTIQNVCKFNMVCSALLGISSVIGLISSPILATLGILLTGISILSCHEICALAKAENKILSDEGLLGNYTTKYSVLRSQQTFVQFLRKEMWLPIFLLEDRFSEQFQAAAH